MAAISDDYDYSLFGPSSGASFFDFDYNDSYESSTSSALCTPQGIHSVLPDLSLVDSYPSFYGSYGVSPQVLHGSFDKPIVEPPPIGPEITQGHSDEDAIGDNESVDEGSVYADSEDNENTYDDDYVEFVKPRRPKAPVSNLRSLPVANMPVGSLKRRRSSASFLDEERPAKRVAHTLPSSPTQTKVDIPVHAKSVSPVPHRPRSTKTIRNKAPPRNIQARVSTLLTNEFVDSLNFVCPVDGCHYVNGKNKRIGDFRRHLETHGYGAPKVHQCTGVRYSDAGRFHIHKLRSVPYVIDNDDEELHVGGCLMTFSRPDALRRHQKNPANGCVCYDKPRRK